MRADRLACLLSACCWPRARHGVTGPRMEEPHCVPCCSWRSGVYDARLPNFSAPVLLNSRPHPEPYPQPANHAKTLIPTYASSAVTSSFRAASSRYVSDTGGRCPAAAATVCWPAASATARCRASTCASSPASAAASCSRYAAARVRCARCRALRQGCGLGMRHREGISASLAATVFTEGLQCFTLQEGPRHHPRLGARGHPARARLC